MVLSHLKPRRRRGDFRLYFNCQETCQQQQIFQVQADNIMLKERKLNIAPAIKKQVKYFRNVAKYFSKSLRNGAGWNECVTALRAELQIAKYFFLKIFFSQQTYCGRSYDVGVGQPILNGGYYYSPSGTMNTLLSPLQQKIAQLKYYKSINRDWSALYCQALPTHITMVWPCSQQTLDNSQQQRLLLVWLFTSSQPREEQPRPMPPANTSLLFMVGCASLIAGL